MAAAIVQDRRARGSGDNVRLFRFHRARARSALHRDPSTCLLACRQPRAWRICAGRWTRTFAHIEAALGVSISHRHAAFRIEGEEAAAASAVGLLQSLYDNATQPIDAQALQLALPRERPSVATA